jgi:hypothetical protein
MLRQLSELRGYTLQASDGELGTVKDVFFDDGQWTLRYFVVDTGSWLPGRKVLISPSSVGEPDWENRLLPVLLTTQQIKDAPSISSDAPVSRQHESRLAGYYGWPMYWSPVAVPSVGMMPARVVPQNPGNISPRMEPTEGEGGTEEPDLRSVEEVTGYHIEADDGEIGHVEEFLADPDGWIIRYMVVDTRNWLPGRKVLLSPDWVQSLVWEDGKVRVGLHRETIQQSPEYDPDKPINREYEKVLYEHYDMPGYWTTSPQDKPEIH